MNDFKPTPAAVIDRLRTQVKALAAASSVDEQIAALFLLHCQIRDAETMLPPTPAPAVVEAQGQEV